MKSMILMIGSSYESCHALGVNPITCAVSIRLRVVNRSTYREFISPGLWGQNLSSSPIDRQEISLWPDLLPESSPWHHLLGNATRKFNDVFAGFVWTSESRNLASSGKSVASEKVVKVASPSMYSQEWQCLHFQSGSEQVLRQTDQMDHQTVVAMYENSA